LLLLRAGHTPPGLLLRRIRIAPPGLAAWLLPTPGLLLLLAPRSLLPAGLLLALPVGYAWSGGCSGLLFAAPEQEEGDSPDDCRNH
jgi:hypothetical protein